MYVAIGRRRSVVRMYCGVWSPLAGSPIYVITAPTSNEIYCEA